MEALIGLALLAAVAMPVVAIIALVMAIGSRDALRKLELRLYAVETELTRQRSARPAAAPEAEPTPAVTQQTVAEPIGPPPPAVEPVAAPVAQPGFEERFGTRWVVRVGGLALALGGIFMVRYTIEQGLIGPGVRIFLGGLLAAILVAAGEWMRRQDKVSGVAAVRGAHIPSILTAAGTTVAYATVYAAYGLYGFLSPAAAFLLLGIVALLTLGASLLHGPALAGLGLVGAFVTPLLVASRTPDYWSLYVYLAVVTGAALGLARLRMWRWLAVTTIAFGTLWMFAGIADPRVDAITAHAFHAIAGFALVASLIVAGLRWGPPALPGRIDAVSSGTLAAYLFAAAMLAIANRHDSVALIVFAVLVAASVAAAWRSDAAVAVVPAAGLLAALVIADWAVETRIDPFVLPVGPAAGAIPEPSGPMVGSHLTLGALFMMLFAASGFLAQGRSERAVAPMLWATTAVVAPVAILIALYYRIAGLERSIPFAGVALLLAAAYAVATETLTQRVARPGLAASAAIFATGAIAALVLALTFALDKGWLTVALALMVPGIAWVALQRPLPALRLVAAAVATLVVLRVGWEPRIVGSDVGTTPIFNWLLWGYGAPAASFWLGGHLLRRRGDDPQARTVDAAAILFTVLLGFLELHHLMNGGDVYRPGTDLAELSLQVAAGLALVIGLERIRGRTGSIVHDIGALVVAALVALAVVLGLWIVDNPLISSDSVGGPFVNLILLGYGLNAVLMTVLALVTRGTRPTPYRIVATVLAVGLALAYFTLEVIRLFHGPVLTAGRTSDAEQYTVSAVWLAFGVALLLIGIWLRSQPTRLASAATVAITVVKVFVVDLASLDGFFRALSFIGLGTVLIGIALLYQRLLFPRQAPPPAEVAHSG